MNDYLHKIHYYETDMMGIVHHSNYIRWFEEARTHWLEQMEMSYAQHEQEGIFSPVLSMSAKYHHPMRYGQTAVISLQIQKITGAKLFVSYQVFESQTRTLCVTGESAHGYVNRQFQPVSLKKEKPQWFLKYKSMEEQQIEEHP